MARLQDFPTVNPTSSDKLLVVQSQGQGLVPYGSKLDSANPTGTGSLSLNRSGNIGTNSVAVGTGCVASGNQSFSEGYYNQSTADQAHSEGGGSIASGSRSHAENDHSTASGANSHAEGSYTTASGAAAHAEGNTTTSSGLYSHTEGNQTTASGAGAHAEGIGTIANHRSQHAFGEYNVADTSTAAATARGNYIEIIGNGSSSIPSNARTLDWSGNETLAGDLTIQGNISLGLRSYSKTVNGITYGLYLMGQMGIFTISGGSFTNAVSAGSTLLTLEDFSSSLAGKKFAASFQFLSATDVTKRFNCANGTNTILSVNAFSAGDMPRGCVPVIII